MHSIRLLLIAATFVVVPHAAAQISLCSGTPFPGGYLNFNPPTPNDKQAVAITVGRNAYDPIGIAAQVQGNSVNVTLTASFIPFGTPPPVACDTISVGPLAPGTYLVSFFVLDPGIPNATPFLAVTRPLVVASGPSAIPATSGTTLAALALLLAVAARYHLRSWASRRSPSAW